MAGSPKAGMLDAFSASRLREIADALGVGGSHRSKTGPGPLDHTYNFQIIPFDRTQADAVKLRGVRRVLALTIKSIRKWS